MMVSAQLSFFDTIIAETGSFYKPGDWVKITKVPKIAKHVKCGHIYKIHSVYPVDGRLEFWNPFSSQWDFLFPGEVRLALAPTDKIDSVTPVEVAVTESTPGSDYFSAVSTYKPRGTARRKEYFRLSYKCGGGKVRHVHIRGGNTDSPIAQAKVQEVRSLLASGVSPAQIAAMLRKSR